MSVLEGLPGWLAQALDRRNRRLSSRFLADTADGTTSIVLVAPPGYYLHALREHLVDEHVADDVQVSEDQRNHGVLWILELETSESVTRRVIAARVPPTLHAHVSVVGTAELAVTADDLAGVAERGRVDACIAAAEGWPEYLRLLEQSSISVVGDGAATAERFVAHDSLLDLLAERCFDSVGRQALEPFRSVAMLEWFTGPMVNALDRSVSISAARLAGLPVVDDGDGRFRISEPIRTLLRDGHHELAVDAAVRLKQPLVAAVGPFGAAEVLTHVGRLDVAGEVLRELPTHVVDGTDHRRAIPLLRLLADEPGDDGRLLLMLARAHLNQSEFTEHRECLVSALERGRARACDSVAIEADAELLAIDLAEKSADENRRHLDSLRARAGANLDRVAQIRLREVEALIDAHTGDVASVYSAAGQLEMVANEWELVGDAGRASMALRTMVATCLVHLGEYPAGITAMERACSMVRDHPAAHRRSLRLLVHLLALAGDERFEERFSDETRLGDRTRDPSWLEAYRHWSLMLHLALRDHAESVGRAHRESRTRLGELMQHETGALFLAESAICFAVVGDGAAARRLLSEACDRTDVDAVGLLLAELTVEARHGDPDVAHDLLQRRRSTLDIPAARGWRFDLECVIAAHRRQDESSPRGGEMVITDATRYGLRPLAERLLALGGVRAFSTALHVEVLGPLRASVGGEPVCVPSGKATELLKLLAVEDRELPIDVVVDHLWPEADLDRGRARLRNCLNRLRNRVGDDSVVRSGDSLRLGPEVTTDLRTFWATVAAVGSNPHAARRALDMFRGDLLEADLYADWLIAPREAVRNAVRTLLRTGDGSVDDELRASIERRIGAV